MTTESNENSGSIRVTSTTAKTPAAEQEQLPCPRCESTNTKFCYYNNYNFSQPRHFCKSCRRYWTHGGTLRDIPVGGGTRKNAKRCRTIHSSSTTTSNNMSVNMMTATVGGGGGGGNGGAALQDYPLHATPVLVPFEGGSAQLKAGHVHGTTFASLMDPRGPGFMALGGLGLGLGSGFAADGSFGGLGRGFWGLTDGSAGSGAGHSGATAAAAGVGNTWQFESGEATPTSGFGTADCFPWPDLAISTPGNGLK